MVQILKHSLFSLSVERAGSHSLKNTIGTKLAFHSHNLGAAVMFRCLSMTHGTSSGNGALLGVDVCGTNFCFLFTL
jgi:hypothetical protein